MGPFFVVVSTPILHFFPGVRKRQEPMGIEALPSHSLAREARGRCLRSVKNSSRSKKHPPARSIRPVRPDDQRRCKRPSNRATVLPCQRPPRSVATFRRGRALDRGTRRLAKKMHRAALMFRSLSSGYRWRRSVQHPAEGSAHLSSNVPIFLVCFLRGFAAVSPGFPASRTMPSSPPLGRGSGHSRDQPLSGIELPRRFRFKL